MRVRRGGAAAAVGIAGVALAAGAAAVLRTDVRAVSVDIARSLPGDSLAATLGCGACHAGIPLADPAPTLPADASDRDPARIFAFLLDPPAPVEGQPRMPKFRLSEAEAIALARALASGRPGSEGGDASRYRAALRRNENADAAAGRRIREALRCDGCHGRAIASSAPPLAGVYDRLDPDWLREFLLRPAPVRPFGWLPGSGTRMPDFSLTPAEADSLLSWLASTATARWSESRRPDMPAPRAATVTESLLRDRWGCTGCHALRGQGGQLGPDLSLAARRLRPGYLRAVLEDPDRLVPGSGMPRPLLEPADLDRLVSYLSHLESPPPATELSALDHPVVVREVAGEGGEAYAARCSACHGATGRGDGYNARYLRARPADHGDAGRMARRPDDTLYDGIHAGARILGGSADMPAFGGSLDPDVLRSLVARIRTLCQCEGPAWSRDDGIR